MTGLSIWGFIQRKTNFGLDVKGGVRLVYSMQLQPNQVAEKAAIRANTLKILERRSQGSFGAIEANVAAKGEDQFIIELPGFTNTEEAKRVLGTSAKIRFFGTRNTKGPRTPYGIYDIEDNKNSGDPGVDFVRRATGERITFTDEKGNRNPKYAEIIASWEKNKVDGELILEGTDLQKAVISLESGARPLMIFSSEGARKMEKWSRANPQGNIAVVLDGRVLSYASVVEGTTLSTEAVIQGTFDAKWVRSFVDLLNSGALPAELKLESLESVDPTIGATAYDKMVMAGMISFGIIALFLVVYYAFPGFLALIALLLYILFSITVLKLIGATFSLAAIAGFILSVGMAVDANILIFERFKEEMSHGKELRKALGLGFSRALPAIIDSNACTILTSLTLLYLGTGPVKGFATTLIIGVGISLFTAVTITRMLIAFFVGSGLVSNPKLFAVERNWFGERFEKEADTNPLPVVQKSKRWFMISLLTIIPGLIFIGLGGIKPNVEFSGGYELTYAAKDASVTGASLVSKLEGAGIKGANVKFGTSQANGKIAYLTLPNTKILKNEKGVTVSQPEVGKIMQPITGLPAEDLKGFTEIGPTVQQETLSNAILGVIISCGLIVIFLAFRFGLSLGNLVAGLRFGASAILALLHDVLVVIGVAAIVGYLVGWEVSALSITAMLTIIGFSVHDTIVIFDRVRENLRHPLAGENFEHLINRSISRSFARSINTSMTVIITLAIIFFAGTATPDLKFFVLTMLVGILSGTYSSIYNASPILYLWDLAIGKKKGEARTLVGLAIAQAEHESVFTATRKAAAEAYVPPTPRPRVAPTEKAADPVADKAKKYGQVRRRANEAAKPRDTDDLL
jgi:SecD/SecF fusion protein